MFKALQKLHRFLTKEELRGIFNVDRYDDVPDYEVVYVGTKNISKRQGRHIENDDRAGFRLKGDNLNLNLEENRNLISPSLNIVEVSSDGEKISNFSGKNCHYIAYNNDVAAAVSNCAENAQGEMTGMLILPDKIVSLKPLPRHLRLKLGHLLRQNNEINFDDIPHFIHQNSEYSEMKRKVSEMWDDEIILPNLKPFDSEKSDEVTSTKGRRSNNKLYLELAVFFDQAAYKRLMPVVKNDDKSLRDMLLGFVNQIQALYYQKALQRKLHITLVHLEIQKKQPSDLPHHDGEKDALLTSFCKYQSKKNPSSDDDPGHWDMALYLSGLNFFGMDKGKKNGITMGLAPVGGVCMKAHSCVISEFGAVNDIGRPYPSAGLMSTYVAAHEMAHNLGMYHDGPPLNKDCASNGFIMSPSRGSKGETVWSSCSSKVLKNLKKDCLIDKQDSNENDHKKYNMVPGQIWDAYDQCRVFLKDEEAILYNDTVLDSVCEQTLCKSPNRIGYYSAGPALDGTFCGSKNWCKDGKCVPWGDQKIEVVSGGWSAWEKGKCESGCITKSKGAQKNRRRCDNPKPKNTEDVCHGDTTTVKLCDDSSICKSRVDVVKYATERCEQFSKYVPDVVAEGTQVPHEEGDRSWQSCAVFCKTKTGSWYTPRHELNDMDVDTYFPDGTWCHNDGKRDYYCQSRLCQPAAKARNQGGKSLRPEVTIDILNNARPKQADVDKKLKEYFEYKKSANRPKPKSGDFEKPNEEDYVIDSISSNV
ncbi:A disintegrin and metalloproteinase with thrombospondin motifs adt-1-like [Centruroides vittatus]|uniref:A disintegrin and metalloproteinase with thrombospondin motifs adt-1-like n=1 Tax=Centruroides vittatus TaxID=120091 RepID=UPI0035105FF3